jgi:hypothetical protein
VISTRMGLMWLVSERDQNVLMDVGRELHKEPPGVCQG